jgi:hypothetical protein
LKWAALFHDITKRGLPEFSGCDHTHPFTGGMQILKIFHRLGFLDEKHPGSQIKLQERLDHVYELIESSVDPVPEDYTKKFEPGEKFCMEVHSHRHFDEIFATLWD